MWGCQIAMFLSVRRELCEGMKPDIMAIGEGRDLRQHLNLVSVILEAQLHFLLVT